MQARASRRTGRLSALWLALAPLVLATSVDAQERTTAVWKEQEIAFLYRSSTSIYECDALRQRVAGLLVAVGARGDVQVKVDDCAHFAGPPQTDPANTWERPTDRYRSDGFGRLRADPTNEQTANVRIRLASPVEATPAVLEEAKKEKTRRELVARVTGNPAAIQQLTGEFPAQWQTVTLSRSSIGLEPEECELLEQMSSSVFRRLGVREISRNMICSRGQSSRIPPKLTVKALISTPFAPGDPQEKPATQDSGAQPHEAGSDATPSEPTR